MVIVISGKMGSGKTSLSNALLEKFGPCGALKMRFAEPLYQMHTACRNILQQYGVTNYDFSKKDGDLLQLLGTEWGRKKIGDLVWVKCILNQVSSLPKNLVVLLEDTRFPNEFDAFAGQPDVVTVRLECPKEIRKERCEMWRENDTHISETALDDYAELGKFDMYFKTDTQTLEEIVGHIMKKIEFMKSEKDLTLLEPEV